MRRLQPSSPLWTILVTVASLVCSLLVYYGLPVASNADDAPGPVSITLFAVGLVVLIAALAFQTRRQVLAANDPSMRVQSIVGLLCPVIVFFAMAYYLIAVRDPTQFTGIASRTDALYFTIVTLGTVGYGDVHPVGSAAKIVTMIQIVFDLVVIGVLISVATMRARQRAEQREQSRHSA